MEIETGIREAEEGHIHQVWFKIGNQTFHLEPNFGHTSNDEAQWFESQLRLAFAKATKEK